MNIPDYVFVCVCVYLYKNRTPFSMTIERRYRCVGVNVCVIVIGFSILQQTSNTRTQARQERNTGITGWVGGEGGNGHSVATFARPSLSLAAAKHVAGLFFFFSLPTAARTRAPLQCDRLTNTKSPENASVII